MLEEEKKPSTEEEKPDLKPAADPPLKAKSVEPLDEEIDEAAAEGAAAAAASKKKKLIIGSAVALLILGGAGTYFFMQEKEEVNVLPTVDNTLYFHDLDTMIINLNTGGTKDISFLKIQISLELRGKVNLDATKQMQPKIADMLHIYLRELRPQDLQGSVGLYRLREEMILRINKILSPAKIDDVLFKEILVQ
jgi:flagellar FliL protein